MRDLRMVVVNLFTNKEGETLEGFVNVHQEFCDAEEKKRIIEESKRVHYEVPTYEKFYSIYRYDDAKFRELLNKWLLTEEGKNRTYKSLRKKQKEILEECYLRDEFGRMKYGDEKHIFRYSALNYEPKYNAKDYRTKAGLYQRIYEELQYRRLISLLTVQERVGHTYAPAYVETKCYEFDNLMIHPDEKQAEIKGTWQLPLGQRVKIHLRLLRFLKVMQEEKVYSSFKSIVEGTGFVLESPIDE